MQYVVSLVPHVRFRARLMVRSIESKFKNKGTHMKINAGVVTRFLTERHYGFLLGDDGHEYFFHELDCPNLPKPIERGQRVLFEIGTFRDKTKAMRLEPETVHSILAGVAPVASGGSNGRS